MNKRIQRLLPVIDMAQTTEREAAAKLGEFQTALQNAQQQLHNLEQYRDDYQQQWIDKIPKFSNAKHTRDYVEQNISRNSK